MERKVKKTVRTKIIDDVNSMHFFACFLNFLFEFYSINEIQIQ